MVSCNYIAGEWVEGPERLRNTNPSDISDVIGEYAAADAAQTETAIDAANAAFVAWRKCSIQQRAEVLNRVADEVLARKDELGHLLAREEGKTLAEGIAEASRAAQIFRFFSGEAVRNSGETIDSLRPGTEISVTREPLGVVGLIAPWNFPLAIPAWKIAPALAYGNCVVFKPAGLVPGCAWALTEILSRSGLPEGVFNLVMGKGSVIGRHLSASPKVEAMSFTGSIEVGREVLQACAAHATRCQLEMGGKNALVVLDDADLALAVECAAQGAFGSTGQRCTASSRLIVTAGIHDAFVEALTERVKNMKVGHALDPDTDMGPVVDDRALERIEDEIRKAEDEGGRLSWGGKRVEGRTRGYFLAPALFTETQPGMEINREEIFGPVASVLKVADYDAALEHTNGTHYGLCAGIVTNSLKHAADFKRNAQVGVVTINAPTAGLDFHVPFGGRKASNYGPREQGRYAREFYTAVKTTYQFSG